MNMHLFKKIMKLEIATLMVVLLVSACDDNSGNDPQPEPEPVLMNQVQYLGTHNSFHIQLRADLFEILLAFSPDVAPTLEYTHVPLTEQFEEQGIRQIELDVFYDPEGGRYAEHKALSLINQDPASGVPELDNPGYKVLHVQEIDYETTCYTLVSCLTELKVWSDANPDHLPVMVLIETKDEEIPDPANLDFTVPLPIDAEALDALDAEIRTVFLPAQLIVPDDIRGDAATLESAILDGSWPSLADARGKIMFGLDNGGQILATYISGHTSLEGRVMFTDSDPGTPEAAFIKQNDPQADPGKIEDLVKMGYLVRTRADADTQQARTNDTSRRDAALASGAHFISTDYPVPNLEFSEYQVSIPGGEIARCNPISGGECKSIKD